MAVDPFGLVLVILIFAGFFGLILYGFLSERLFQKNRTLLIRKFKESPVIKKDAPILVKGYARSPDIVLPTSGEHVAFYALFIITKETSMTGNIRWGTRNVTNFKGFRIFEMSGDFSVVSGTTPFVVSMSSAMARFVRGSSAVYSLIEGTVQRSGFPRDVYKDAMECSGAEAALRTVTGYNAPIKSLKSFNVVNGENTSYESASVVSVTSSIDARVHYYITGYTLPPAVSEILAKRGIVPENKEEFIVMELFIPLGKEVYIFGTFDGDKSIVFSDSRVRLSVSYDDPETAA